MSIARVIGKSSARPVGDLRLPTAEELAWVETMARYRTRVPKFRYRSMAEANADWDRWHAELVL